MLGWHISNNIIQSPPILEIRIGYSVLCIIEGSMVINVLIVTADTAHATLLENSLAKDSGIIFKTELVTLLSDSLERIITGDIDAILLDLSLPDSQGITTLDQVSAEAPDIPIIVFTGPGEDELAQEAVERGAERYLPKGRFGSELIAKYLHNISQRKEIEEILFIEKTRAQITLNSISDAVISTDTLGNIDYLNQAAENMTGWPLSEARGRPIQDVLKIINGKTREPDQNPVEQVLRKDEEMGLTAGTILIQRDGGEVTIEDSAAPIHDSCGHLCGAVIVFHDISASKAMTEKMAFMAQHDTLTNLPNRTLLNDRIQQAIEHNARRTTTLSVLFLDLDNFKEINDSLGHDIGDDLLCSVANRISSCLRSSDTVSRIGGDEFVILILDCNQAETAQIIADKILTTLADPHLIGEHILRITTSIGIATYPGHGNNAETLIKNADYAMYQAKKKGRNNYQIFGSEYGQPGYDPDLMVRRNHDGQSRRRPA